MKDEANGEDATGLTTEGAANSVDEADRTTDGSTSRDEPVALNDHTLSLGAASSLESSARRGAATGAPIPQVPGYRILGELGRGGMGVVYHAIQLNLNRQVALKMVLAGEHASPEAKQRFHGEAEAVARLQHSGIVHVHEFGSHAGNPYFAFEYIPGGSLDRRLREGPLPPQDAADVIRKLADAVHVAHEQRIVHRDLKPANVLLTDKGEPKITDFGLAKQAGSSDLTATGAVIGTPSYMAPEQAAGKVKEIGPASDVYALGSMLYECLVGRPPFKAATAMETLQQVLCNEPAPVRRLNPGLDRDLETICLKCLAKDPKRRYDSARTLSDDLGRYLHGEPIEARPAGRVERAVKWAKRHPTVAVGILCGLGFVALLLAISTVFNIWLHREAELASRNEIAAKSIAEEAKRHAADAQASRIEKERALEATRVTFLEYGGTAALQRNPTESALWFAHAALFTPLGARSANATRSTYLQAMAAQPIRALALGFRAQSLAIHPSGEEVLIMGAGGCRRWRLPQDEVLDLSLGGDTSTYAAYSASGKLLAIGSTSGRVEVRALETGRIVSKLEVDGRLNTLLFHDDDLLAVGATAARVWSIRRNAFVSQSMGSESKDGRAVALRFNRPGTQLAVAFGGEKPTACVFSFGEAGTRPLFPPVPHVQPWARYDYQAPFFANNDTTLIFNSRDGAVSWMNLATRTRQREREFGSYLTGSQMSPDGKWLSVYMGSQVALVRADNGQVVAEWSYAPEECGATDVAFTNDGAGVVVGTSEHKIHELGVSTWKPASPHVYHPGWVDLVRVSADDRLLVSAARTGLIRVWLRPKPVELYQHKTWPAVREHHLFTLSPDGGHFVACGRDVPKGDCQVYATSTGEGAGPTLRLGRTPLNAAWSADGNKLVVYCADPDARDSETIVHVLNWREGKPLLPPFRVPFVPLDVIFSPDARHLVLLGQAGQLETRSAETGKLEAAGRHPGERARITFFPNRKIRFVPGGAGTFITNGPGASACLWQGVTQLNKPLRVFTQEDRGECLDAQVSPDGRWLATSGLGSLVHVWDLLNGAGVGRLEHTDWVFTTRFTPDSAVLVTACRDRYARVWDWRTGKQVSLALAHDGEITGLALSHDGSIIATGGSEGTVRVWERATGKPMLPPLRFWPENEPRRVSWALQLAFHHQDAELIAAVRDRGVFNFRVAAGAGAAPLQPTDLVLRAELAAGQTLSQTGGVGLMSDSDWVERWKTLRAVPSLYPAWPELTADKVDWHRRRATRARNHGQFEVARFHFEQITTTNRADRASWQQQALLAWRTGDRAKTVACFNEAVRHGGSLADLWLLAFQDAPDREAANHALEQAVAASEGGDLRARRVRAQNAVKTKKWDAALPDWRHLHEQDPEDRLVAAHYALLAFRLGDRDRARVIRATQFKAWQGDAERTIPYELLPLFWIDPQAPDKADTLVSYLERYAGERSQSCHARHLLGPLLVRVGRTKEGEANIKTAMQLCQSTGRVTDHVFLCLTAVQEKRTKDAESHLAKARDASVQGDAPVDWAEGLLQELIIAEAAEAVRNLKGTPAEDSDQ